MRAFPARPTFGLLLIAALAIAAVFRFAWPLADPPEGMSWSTGSYTDPPSNVLAARYAVQGRPGGATDDLAPLVYPALNALARIGYELMGPRRLATVVLAALLGMGSVAFLALALRRGPGERAALCGAFLAATSAWLVPNSRVLMAENIAVLLLLWATYLATSRRLTAAVASGAVAAAAGLFGKYHALAFLPALGVFLGLRTSWAAAAAASAGAIGVAGVWLVAVFAPHPEILPWIRAFFAEGAGDVHPKLWLPGLALAPFGGLQQSWIVPQMPIVFGVGAWFVARTLGARGELRRRIDDGSALFVLWTVASFSATALLPYRAPRYFTLVAAPLVACAACQIASLLTPPGDATARRPLGWFPRLLWWWIVAFATIQVGIRVEAFVRRRFFLDEWVRDPNPPATFSKLYDVVGSVAQQALMTLPVAVLVLLVLRLRRRRVDASAARRAGIVLLGLALAFDLVSWGAWALERTTTIEDAKRSLVTVLSPDAVILGGFAPLVTEGTSLVAVPMFGTFRASILAESPRPTHLLLVGSDFEKLTEAVPDLAQRLEPVARWPIRTIWAKAMVLYRLPAPELPDSYRLSVFEQATVAVNLGDAARALALTEELRRTQTENADLVLLEAVCRATAGELTGAERLLLRASELRPMDTIPFRTLGAIAFNRADTTAARKYWMQALALDPLDSEIPALVWTFLEHR